jgi:hypothetical protein
MGDRSSLLSIDACFDRLKAHVAQGAQLTDEEIRAIVKQIIETGDDCRLLELLEVHSTQVIQLTDEEIRMAVRELIEKGGLRIIFDLLEAYFDKYVELTDEEIKATVKKLIEIGHHGNYFIRPYFTLPKHIFTLLRAHFAQKIQLTDKEIGFAVWALLVNECCFTFQEQIRKNFAKDYIPKLTQRQIVAFVKETDLNLSKMTNFLTDYSQELDSNRFQWIVEASPPRYIRSFWKECPKTLSQEKRIIVSISVQRQKLIAILKAVSKQLGCFKMFVQYLNLAPWQDLRYLLPESDV